MQVTTAGCWGMLRPFVPSVEFTEAWRAKLLPAPPPEPEPEAQKSTGPTVQEFFGKPPERVIEEQSPHGPRQDAQRTLQSPRPLLLGGDVTYLCAPFQPHYNREVPEDEKPVASFEAGLGELESIVKQMESSDLPLDRALDLFEKGMKLSETCRKQLEEAETRVEVLVRRGDKVIPQPFRPEKA